MNKFVLLCEFNFIRKPDFAKSLFHFGKFRSDEIHYSLLSETCPDFFFEAHPDVLTYRLNCVCDCFAVLLICPVCDSRFGGAGFAALLLRHVLCKIGKPARGWIIAAHAIHSAEPTIPGFIFTNTKNLVASRTARKIIFF